MIVKAGKSMKIGESAISMQEILDQIQLRTGDIVEKDVHARGSSSDTACGIYGLQPGDNIWNIHFDFLKDYFVHRGVTLSFFSDEPDLRGRSSGVVKLLKFLENMIHIYNIREHELDKDIHMVQPLRRLSSTACRRCSHRWNRLIAVTSIKISLTEKPSGFRPGPEPQYI